MYDETDSSQTGVLTKGLTSALTSLSGMALYPLVSRAAGKYSLTGSDEASQISRRLENMLWAQGTSVTPATTIPGSWYVPKWVASRAYKLGSKTLVTPGSAGDAVTTLRSPLITAARYGHSQYADLPGRTGGKFGKVMQKGYLPAYALSGLAGWGGSILSAKAGTDAAEAEAAGEKAPLSTKIVPAAVAGTGITAISPVLVSQYLGTKKGLETLKRLGASPSLMRRSRLAAAGLGVSYALPVTLGLISSSIGPYEVAKKRRLEQLKEDSRWEAFSQ